MTIKKRLDTLIKELGYSGRAFEKECELANGSYSSIGDGVGADKLNKILSRFPHVSADWLINGQGSMFKSLNSDSETEKIGSLLQGSLAMVSFDGDEIKNLVFQLTHVITDQQSDINRLISELERTGSRSERMLGLIEGGRTMVN